MKKLILPILVLLLVASVADAQSRNNYQKYRQSLQKTGFRGIGLGAGLYFPSMDFYADSDYDFDITPAFMLGQEFWLYKPLAARLAVGYQKSSGTRTSGDFSESQEITFIPISIDGLFYMTSATRFSKTPQPSFYFGAGVEITQLNLTYNSTGGSPQDLSGGTTLAHGIVGMEYPIAGNLKIGLEAQYVFGKYEQTFVTEGNNSYLQEISVSGPKAFFSVKYVISEYIPRRGRAFPRRR